LPEAHLEIRGKTGFPLEHLDHSKEFEQWLKFLRREFKVDPNAEERIISFLKKKISSYPERRLEMMM